MVHGALGYTAAELNASRFGVAYNYGSGDGAGVVRQAPLDVAIRPSPCRRVRAEHRAPSTDADFFYLQTKISR